jgi:hypothetical protein
LQSELTPRRARLRIPKSPPSKRFFAFQKTIDLRGENALVHAGGRIHE